MKTYLCLFLLFCCPILGATDTSTNRTSPSRDVFTFDLNANTKLSLSSQLLSDFDLCDRNFETLGKDNLELSSMGKVGCAWAFPRREGEKFLYDLSCPPLLITVPDNISNVDAKAFGKCVVTSLLDRNPPSMDHLSVCKGKIQEEDFAVINKRISEQYREMYLHLKTNLSIPACARNRPTNASSTEKGEDRQGTTTWHWLVVLMLLAPLLIAMVVGTAILGSQRKVTLKHNRSGLMKDGYYGFSVTYLLFGWLVPCIRGEFRIGVLHLILSLLSAGIFQLVMAFFYNKQYTHRLLNSGWELDDSELDAEARERLALPSV
jgi:hypothetical protein